MLENLALGFKISLSLHNIIYCFIGCTLGTIIGVLPGLGPAATIALLLTFTYKLDVIPAIIMLSGIYYGAQYGGTITSVLLKIPGEAATVVTVIDGYQMAIKGEAGKALGIAAFGSFIAGTFGTIFLSILAPPLSEFALKFGPPEYTSLMILGLTLVIYLGGKSIIKAILMGALGLALGAIGLDPVTSFERFTFGTQSLMDGIDMAILAMGLFGIGEILYMAERRMSGSSPYMIKCPKKLRELLPNRKDWKASIKPIGRGSVLGFLVGILPGGGAVIASFLSYAVEKKFAKNPEKFGKGAIEGVAGPESANNAASSGAFVPLLTLGIPSNVVMALLIGAFMVHGVTPGPFILKQCPDLFWGIVTSMYIGNIILLILNVPLIKLFVKIIEIPYVLLSPLIVFVCMIGAYSINNNPVDILLMIVFGVMGYLMRKFDYEAAPLMLAYVLGPMLEKSLRQSLIISQGSPLIFFYRPISMGLMAVTLLFIVSPLFTIVLRRYRLFSKLEQIKKSTSETD
jgi:putative tricarboxylic transport membrane protein